MSGTRLGGQKCAKTNKYLYGDDFYKKIGTKGGRSGGPNRGFAANPELARTAGSKGGKKSHRKEAVMPKLERHKRDILRRVDKGESYKDIASVYGVYVGTLVRFVKDAV